MVRVRLWGAVLLAGLVLAGCSGGGGTAGWDDFADRFLDSTFEANPHFAVYQGRHEFDGKLPDWSEDGLRAEIARLKEFRQAAEAFDPSALDDRRRLEREHVLAQIDGDLFWLETAEAPWRNPAFYRGALDPNVYASRPYAPLPERMKAITKWAQNIPHALEQVRASLRAPMPKTYVYFGRSMFSGFAEYLRDDLPQVYAEVEDQKLHDEFKAAMAGAFAAFEERESRWRR